MLIATYETINSGSGSSCLQLQFLKNCGTPLFIIPAATVQVLRQQMEMVQNQMQRLQAHREQEGLNASRAPSFAQQDPAGSRAAASSSAAEQPSSSAARPASPAQDSPAAARTRPPHVPIRREGSNSAEEIRQRRLNHFHTRE